MKRTIKEWFSLVKDEDLREKLLKNHDPKNGGFKDYVYGIEEAIHLGFNWHKTIEGCDYWEYIYGSNIELLDEPKKDFKTITDGIKVKNPKSTHYHLWENTEVIDVIKSMLTEEEYKGFLKGNLLKYRLRDKGQDESDKEKAKDYKNELEHLNK